MRYVIGCSIEDKETRNKYDGLIVFSGLGLNYILTDEILDKDTEKGNKTYICVYDDLATAEKEVSKFAKAYRRDDVWTKEKHWVKSKKIRKFYLIKVDSPKFPYTLKVDTERKNKKTEKNKEIYIVKKKYVDTNEKVC